MANSFFKNKWFLGVVLTASVVAVATVFTLNRKPKDIADNNATTLNDSIQLAEFYKKEEAKPFINSPLQGVTIPFIIYKVNAQQGGTLHLKSGTKIVIPKDIFVDEKDNLLKGEVELRCREFRDPVDFFVSGIPMTYDSAGVRYQFESAGMIEIMAYQNGKQVNVASKKSITVELASNYKGTEYNVYKLDTLKNNWSCLGKDKVVVSKNAKVKTKEKEVATDYPTTPEGRVIEEKKVTVEKEKDQQIAALPTNIVQPKKPEKANDTKYNFNLVVDANDYPELAIYKGLLFQVGDENKNFNESSYNVVWDDATIKEGPKKGENYLLTLRKGSKKYTLVVYPVFEGKNYDEALKTYQDKYTKYTALLNKRREDEKRIEAEYQARLAELKKQQITLRRKWEDEQKEEINKMASGEEKIKRVFAINGFGVYNCDHAMPYPKGVSCIVGLMTDKKQKLICYDIFLVDGERNALFNFYKNPVINFSFNPQSKNILWTVENGVLYWLKPEQFNDIKVNDGKAELDMNKTTQKFKTAEDIKSFFNL